MLSEEKIVGDNEVIEIINDARNAGVTISADRTVSHGNDIGARMIRFEDYCSCAFIDPSTLLFDEEERRIHAEFYCLRSSVPVLGVAQRLSTQRSG